jgi:hypothetical protein
MKRFLKAANKLGDLNTILLRLSKTFLYFGNRFPKQLNNNSSGFPAWVLANPKIQKPWNAANKLAKFFQKM